jgi:L-asparagine transporter-like permease
VKVLQNLKSIDDEISRMTPKGYAQYLCILALIFLIIGLTADIVARRISASTTFGVWAILAILILIYQISKKWP